MKYKLVKDYKKDEELRKSFHELTQKTFGFTLEDWYQKGFWGDNYVPYSLVEGNRIIANVSVNYMDFVICGEHKKYIQLGTVMTDENYRNQGLAAYLMNVVLEDVKNKTELIYLFANDSVLNFYPKFGFQRSTEYQCRKTISNSQKEKCVRRIDMTDEVIRKQVLDTISNMAVNHEMQMNNYGLYGFYVDGFMKDQLYYCPRENCYIVAEIQDKVLYLNEIFGRNSVNTDQLIASFGEEAEEVILGFTPFDSKGYELKEHKEEDCTLFLLGDIDEAFVRGQLRFPVLSHA